MESPFNFSNPPSGREGSLTDLLEEANSNVLKVVGAPGVGKSTRFPLTLVQKVPRKVIVVTPTVIGAKALTSFVQPEIRTDIVGKLEYWDLNKYYNAVLRQDQAAVADIVCIDDAQLTKLEQTLLFLVLLHRLRDPGTPVGGGPGAPKAELPGPAPIPGQTPAGRVPALWRGLILLGISIPQVYIDLAKRELPQLEFTGKRYTVTTTYLEISPEGQEKVEACVRELTQFLLLRTGSTLLIVRNHDVGRYAEAIRRQFPAESVFTVTADDYDAAIFNTNRCVIISTPVLETTITIPDLEIVVDSMEMDMPRTRSNGSIIASRKSWISQLQASQRQGRVGRTRPGTCLRLCSQDFLESLPLDYPVEIELINLSVPQLRLHLHDLADVIPKHLDARPELVALGLLLPARRQVAELITRLPLGLVPGWLASQWLPRVQSAEEIAALVLYVSLVEVEGPFIGTPIFLPDEHQPRLRSWAGPSDFHVLLQIIEDVAPLGERWINPAGLLYADNWKEAVSVMKALRHQLEREGYVASDDLDLWKYLPNFQRVAKEALPMAIYSYADDLGKWIQVPPTSTATAYDNGSTAIAADGAQWLQGQQYSPNSIYPEKNRSPVQVALAILGDVVILGLGLD